MIVNAHRGEMEVQFNGKPYRLRLTLGGLAELEVYFQAENLHALLQCFGEGRIAAQDLIKVLSVGLKGGGNPMAEEDLEIVSYDGGLAGIARIVGDLFAVTFTEQDG